MATTLPNLWQQEQNTKYPADTHWLALRVTLPAAGTTTTLNVPSGWQNPAQQTFPGIPPTGEPQQGKRFFLTKAVVRDANGALGGTAGGSVAVQDVTTGVTLTTVTLSTTAGANPAYIIQPVTTGAGVVGPNDQVAVTYTAPTAGTPTATSFVVDLFGYWQQYV